MAKNKSKRGAVPEFMRTKALRQQTERLKNDYMRRIKGEADGKQGGSEMAANKT